MKFVFFLLTIYMFSLDSLQAENMTVSSNSQTHTDIKQNEASKHKIRIVFLGDSLTAGYGLDEAKAYPALIGKYFSNLPNLTLQVLNAGVSGDTTAGGLARLGWVLKGGCDIFVLALGANDGLRGFSTTQTKKNLQEIIKQTRKKYPSAKIILAGMLVPPNMGESYAEEYRAVFPALAKSEQVSLIPFLLEGVAGIPELNLSDGIHPTEKGQDILAKNVLAVLEPIVKEMVAQPVKHDR